MTGLDEIALFCASPGFRPVVFLIVPLVRRQIDEETMRFWLSKTQHRFTLLLECVHGLQIDGVVCHEQGTCHGEQLIGVIFVAHQRGDIEQIIECIGHANLLEGSR